jgi:hypothetical protein
MAKSSLSVNTQSNISSACRDRHRRIIAAQISLLNPIVTFPPGLRAVTPGRRDCFRRSTPRAALTTNAEIGAD